MRSTKIKDAIKQKLEVAETPSVEEFNVEDQVDVLSEASIAGHKAFIAGSAIEDNPFLNEDENYTSEAWNDGWQGAFDSMVLSSVVVMAKKLVEAKDAEEVDYYFDELTEASKALNPQVFGEFYAFLSECNDLPDIEEDEFFEEE